MKKENKKAAQLKRAKERERKEKLDQITKYLIVIIPAAVLLAVFIFIILAMFGSKKNEEPMESQVETGALSEAMDDDERVSEAEKRTVVENGDTIDLDYTGYLDGEPFDRGSTNGQGTTLKIGSGTYIPGFEEGCIGHEIGETFDLTVTFPDNYGNASLAGKEAVFTITINDILDDN